MAAPFLTRVSSMLCERTVCTITGSELLMSYSQQYSSVFHHVIFNSSTANTCDLLSTEVSHIMGNSHDVNILIVVHILLEINGVLHNEAMTFMVILYNKT